MQQLLTTEEVADWLRVEVVTVRRLITRGDLPAYRVGAEYRFKTSDLEEYLESRRVKSSGGGVKDLVRITADLGRKAKSSSLMESDVERFTGRAKEVLALARQEAAMLDHDFVGTEHLLLALIAEGDGIAARVLREFDVEAEVVRKAVQELVGRGNETRGSSEAGITSRLKKAIQLGVEEARQLGHGFVGTEHLLLGLLGERKGGNVAARILADLEVDAEGVRRRVLQVLQKA